jgi:NtrC-family two-component system sensor histidine kinase KinB
MSNFFLDSSAVVKRYQHETGSNWITLLLDPIAGHTIILGEITLAEAFAAYAAIAIENARLYAEVRRHVQELEQQALELQAQRDFVQQVMNALGQGVTVTDAEGRFEYVNPAYARLFGYSPAGLIGKRPADVTPPEDQAILAEAHARRREGETTTYETRLIRADGSMAHVLITGTPRWREGRLAGAIAAITDLTERKRAEEEIRRLREDMSHMLVHDLRNPLGIISTARELVRSEIAEGLSPDLFHALDIMGSQTLKLQGLVNRILEIGQLEHQQVPLAARRAPIELAHLIGQVLELQAPQASAKGVRLESNVPPDLPPAWADAELIGRVLQNLVDNACKFTPSGGLVGVTARVGESEGRRALLVSVTDTGSGIPDEIRNRLFQKFVRGQQMGRGSGLGLAFCKLAVEAHGGRIEVESASGRGTTFTFSLNTAPNT